MEMDGEQMRWSHILKYSRNADIRYFKNRKTIDTSDSEEEPTSKKGEITINLQTPNHQSQSNNWRSSNNGQSNFQGSYQWNNSNRRFPDYRNQQRNANFHPIGNNNPKTENIEGTSPTDSARQEIQCSYCNRTRHTYENCRLRLNQCLICGKTGHRKAECKFNRFNQQSPGNTPQSPGKRPNNRKGN